MKETPRTKTTSPVWKHSVQLVTRFLAPFSGLGAALLLGCAQTTEVHVTTIIKDAEVAGPVSPVPVHVVTPHSKNRVALTVHGSYQGSQEVKGVINGSPPGSAPWLYPQDTLHYSGTSIRTVPRTPKTNLTWNLPDFTGGLDLDIAWEHVALTGGVNVSSVSGEALIGWSAGLGLFKADTEGVGIRLEGGILGQTLAYDASTVQIVSVTTSGNWFSSGSSSVDTFYYRDFDKNMKLGFYGSLMLNTAYPKWPLNIFLQASVFTQPLLEYEPSRLTTHTFGWMVLPYEYTTIHKSEASTSVVLFGLTPGIYIEPSPTILITAGARIIFDFSNAFKEPSNLVMPFLQFSLSIPN
jgi:hypothetical protein